MTAVHLDVAFRDVRAHGLRWSLGLPRLSALASRRLVCGGAVVELRVLGASHQVVVERPGALPWSETLACDLADSEPMPGQVADGGYVFESRVTALAADAFEARIQDLRSELAEDRSALVAAFPGTPYAVTAMRLAPGPAPAWETWHAYPQHGELVHTRSSLDVDRKDLP